MPDPLGKRINSSNVPADFKLGHPNTDPAVVERATQLYAEIETAPQPPKASTAAGDKIEAAFNQRVQYVASLDSEYAKTQQEIVALQIEREQMRQGYKAEQRRLEIENARIAARAESGNCDHRHHSALHISAEPIHHQRTIENRPAVLVGCQ
jgi:hypothetical protein